MISDSQSFDYIPTISPDDIVTSIRSSEMAEVAIHDNTDNSVDDASSSVSQTQSKQNTMLSSLSRARVLLSNGDISYDEKLRVFNVKGSASVHVVTLFPKEKCSCPSTSTCYHVLAAKLFLGMDVAECKPKKQILTEEKMFEKKKKIKEGVNVLDQKTLIRLIMKVRADQTITFCHLILNMLADGEPIAKMQSISTHVINYIYSHITHILQLILQMPKRIMQKILKILKYNYLSIFIFS